MSIFWPLTKTYLYWSLDCVNASLLNLPFLVQLYSLANSSLPIVHCQFFTANSSLPILHCQLFTANSSLPILLCQFFTANSSLPILHCKFFTANSSLPILHCQFFTANSTFVVNWTFLISPCFNAKYLFCGPTVQFGRCLTAKSH